MRDLFWGGRCRDIEDYFIRSSADAMSGDTEMKLYSVVQSHVCTLGKGIGGVVVEVRHRFSALFPHCNSSHAARRVGASEVSCILFSLSPSLSFFLQHALPNIHFVGS